MHMTLGQRQQLGQRRQRPRRDHVGRKRRHRLDPQQHGPSRVTPQARAASRRNAALRWSLSIRCVTGAPEHGQHQARQPGAAAEIGQYLRTRRPESPELAAVEDMAAPRIGQCGGADQVDLGLPAHEQIEIGLQPVQCFT